MTSEKKKKVIEEMLSTLSCKKYSENINYSW